MYRIAPLNYLAYIGHIWEHQPYAEYQLELVTTSSVDLGFGTAKILWYSSVVKMDAVIGPTQ